MSRCRSCNAPLRWIRTSAGRDMPCNVDQVVVWVPEGGIPTGSNAGAVIVTSKGETVRGELTRPLIPAEAVFGHTPHWSTCPDAAKFRKGGRR